MIRYKLYQNNNANNVDTYGKWYARVYVDETYDLEQLSEHMANHNTPYSAGTINGVLKDMVNCIKELLLDGKGVKLDDFAIFSIGISSSGADSADDFNVARNITGVKLRARGTGDFTPSELASDAVKRHLTEYSIVETVDTSDDDEDADDDDSTDDTDSSGEGSEDGSGDGEGSGEGDEEV